MKKLPAKLSEWMKSKIKKSETQRAFFERVINDEKLALDFVEFVVKNPRLNKPIYRSLSGLIPPVRWRIWLKKYGEMYSVFVHQKWDKAKLVDDVLKIVPNFSPWSLKDRFGTVRLGKIPTEFGDEKSYIQFLTKVLSSKVIQEYKRIKFLENNLAEFARFYPEIKKIDWFDMTQRTHFLSKLLHKIAEKPFSVQNARQKYLLRFLCNPFSCKMVFEVQVNRKRFILKMAVNPVLDISSDDKRKEAENQAIRADSPYSNALMEFYLKLNKCPHVCDIQYYTSQYEAVLYTAEKGIPFISPHKKWDFYDLNTKLLKDMNRLGIYINDVSPANFIVSPKNILKVIDIGHASFANPMTPGIPGLTFAFGNLSGQDYLMHFGVMSMED